MNIAKIKLIDTYRVALQNAIAALEMFEELEIRSALKQAASDQGIDYGDDMSKFVDWAEKQMGF